MPMPYSVSSKAVMEKKRKHLVTKSKTEEVTEKEDIQKPGLDGGSEAGSAWIVFLEEAAQEAEVRRKDRAADCPPSAQVLGLLAGLGLRRLDHRKVKFPWAQWFCQVCDFHCENLAQVKNHLELVRHSQLARAGSLTTTLMGLPPARDGHLAGIQDMLENVHQEGLSAKDLETRAFLASQLHQLLSTHIPGCEVLLFGSSLSGFGLQDSGVDLELSLALASDWQPHLALLRAAELLRQSHLFREVQEDFLGVKPTLRFLTSSSPLPCRLSLGNSCSVQTSLLLRDYRSLEPRLAILGTALRLWAREVGLDRQEEGGMPRHALDLILVYFLQREKVLPCIHDWLKKGELYISPEGSLKQWREGNRAGHNRNSNTVAELWLGLFRWLALDLKGEGVISLVQEEQRTDFKGKRLTIEDPFSARKNLCRIISQEMLDYVSGCFRTSFLYFGSPQTSLGPVIESIKGEIEAGSSSKDNTEALQEDRVETPGEGRKDCLGALQEGREVSLETWQEDHGTALSPCQAQLAVSLVPMQRIIFSLTTRARLAPGLPPPPQCLACSQPGHTQTNCPEELLPLLEPLPVLEECYLALLDSMCCQAVAECEPVDQELQNRGLFMEQLGCFIQGFWPAAELQLFGSSSNGFPFHRSDLDISLTFRGLVSAASLDSVELVEELAAKIRVMPGAAKVLSITHAKVPIVKMFYSKYKLEADISLYNVLARENTRMLALYSSLDPRAKLLGYLVKLFAKVCHIGDASKGSLSSYAYILLVVFYLQQVEPPVLPVLQQLHPPGEQPQMLVEGWNAWFCSDPEQLIQWPGQGKNKDTVAQLWIGFLDFYSGTFDDRGIVVAVRQREPLTKFEKMWNSRCIAIEDPFELSHNLGTGLSRKMWLYIKRAFIQGRHHFGLPLDKLPAGLKNIQEHFFDARQLTVGPPPLDRNRTCFQCGRVGHIIANCPTRKDRKVRERSKSLNDQQVEGVPEPDALALNSSLCVGMLERKKKVKENKGELAKHSFLRGGTEEAIQDAALKEPVNYPGTKVYLKPVNKKLEEVVELALFNYNSVKPRMVSDDAIIDYLKPLSVEEEQGFERMSESFSNLSVSERRKECTGLQEVRRLILLQIQQCKVIVDNMATKVSSMKSVDRDGQVTKEVKSQKVAKKDGFNYNSVKPNRVLSSASNYLAPLGSEREQEFSQLFESINEDEVTEAAEDSSVMYELRKTNSQQRKKCSEMLRFCKEREKEEAEQLMETEQQLDVAGELLDSFRGNETDRGKDRRPQPCLPSPHQGALFLGELEAATLLTKPEQSAHNLREHHSNCDWREQQPTHLWTNRVPTNILREQKQTYLYKEQQPNHLYREQQPTNLVQKQHPANILHRSPIVFNGGDRGVFKQMTAQPQQEVQRPGNLGRRLEDPGSPQHQGSFLESHYMGHQRSPLNKLEMHQGSSLETRPSEHQRSHHRATGLHQGSGQQNQYTFPQSSPHKASELTQGIPFNPQYTIDQRCVCAAPPMYNGSPLEAPRWHQTYYQRSPRGTQEQYQGSPQLDQDFLVRQRSPCGTHKEYPGRPKMNQDLVHQRSPCSTQEQYQWSPQLNQDFMVRQGCPFGIQEQYQGSSHLDQDFLVRQGSLPQRPGLFSQQGSLHRHQQHHGAGFGQQEKESMLTQGPSHRYRHQGPFSHAPRGLQQQKPRAFLGPDLPGQPTLAPSSKLGTFSPTMVSSPNLSPSLIPFLSQSMPSPFLLQLPTFLQP